MKSALWLFILGPWTVIWAAEAEQSSGVIADKVPVGNYLYADLAKIPAAEGSLKVLFASPGPNRVVVAYGRKNRKDRKSRDGTVEAERENFKPRLGKTSPDGSAALFDNLPPDFYDLFVIDPSEMSFFEGAALNKLGADASLPTQTSSLYQEEIRQSLGLRIDRLGGWEGFFDHKRIERIEVTDEKAGVLMQQLRLGVALAESGERLHGTIHSLDVVWVERAIVAEAGWQVINRQQIYREELVSREFFQHKFLPALQGLRVGSKEKLVGPIELK